MQHVMIDIETLGLTPDATILSIGAVEFDETDIGRTFYFELCPDQGRYIDPGTALWWAQQSAAFNDGLVKYQLDAALHHLSGFLDLKYDPEQPMTAGFKGSNIWANSPSFDCSILRNAYDQHGMECPWKFWHELDVRTIRRYLPKGLQPIFQGRKHHALDDALHQARVVQAFFNKTGLTL